MQDATDTPVIGLEVHVRLATGRKLFCRCAAVDAAPANRHTCDVCRGVPGALPVVDPAAVHLALCAALALGATPAATVAWHRKHYTWPDLPKGYQITQQGTPLATDGIIHDLHADRQWPLASLHVEEDAGRFEVRDGVLHLDDNRAGVPLIELTTPPCLRTAEETEACLRALHATLVAAGVTEGLLHHGHLRADVNVSLADLHGRPGPRVEVKNLGSFRHAAQAVTYELARQAAVRATGGTVAAETRAWQGAHTVPLRDKDETAYRVLPEPDLRDLHVTAALLARAGKGVTAPLAPWLRTLAQRPEAHGRRRLAHLLALVADGSLTPDTVDAVLAARVPAEPPPPAPPVPTASTTAVDEAVVAVLADHPDEVGRYRDGDARLLGWFIGTVMARLGRQADPALVRTALMAALHG